MIHLTSFIRVPLKTEPKGFTLVETLVAITILMIAIVGPFYAIQQSINYAYDSRDSLIANSLAQEAMEYVYFVRDNNYLSSDPSWLDSLSPCTGTNGCVVDPTQSTVTACVSSGCPAVKMSSSGLYTQTGSYPDTRFVRTVTIRQVTTTQVKVTVKVAWTTDQRAYSTTVSEDLYNWL